MDVDGYSAKQMGIMKQVKYEQVLNEQNSFAPSPSTPFFFSLLFLILGGERKREGFRPKVFRN